MPKKQIVNEANTNTKGNKAPETQNDIVIMQGIWGLIYLAVGALLFISILFFHPGQLGESGVTHILGPYFGTGLALGMFWIFGRLSAFVFAGAVCYIGLARLFNKELRLKLLVFLAILMLELCVLLAIGYMSELSTNRLMATIGNSGSNFIGLFLAYAMVPLFAGRTLGPYIIISVLIAITLFLGLRIKPQSAAAVVAKLLAAIGGWLKAAFVDAKTSIKNSPDIREDKPESKDVTDTTILEDTDKKPSGKKDNDVDVSASVPAVAVASIPTDEQVLDMSEPTPPVRDTETDSVNGTGTVKIDAFDDEGTAKELTPEEETKKRLEDELCEFRKKKHEPIIIHTVDTVEVEPDDDETGILPIANDDYDVIDDISDNKIEINDKDDGGFKVTELPKSSKPYILPSPDILSDLPQLSDMIDKDAIERNSEILERTLMNFGVEGRVVGVSPGPVVTRYEIALAPGVKISRVLGLHDDISMAVSGKKIRIQAPIPGKSAIGIELPNDTPQFVHFKHILLSDKFKKSDAKLPMVVGSNISGAPFVTDITKTPHLLVAGQTGAGKSVYMNSLICSLLMTKTPEELRLIMIDPKQVEFMPYENIPHLLSPVVNEPKEAVKALQWGVMEMERRYGLLLKAGVKKIDDFNAKFDSGKLVDILPEHDNKRLPYIVIIVDELADLMTTAPKDVEGPIMRIAQKARAAGIHLILATQRPEVKIITGAIKANLPSRIAFRTVSSIDSRTILDGGGAEELLGNGDMLFSRNGAPDIERFHGAYIKDEDMENIVEAVKNQQVEIDVINSFSDIIGDDESDGSGNGNNRGGCDDVARDELFEEAARVVVSIGQGSTSLLQRRMNIGFARAGRIMDQLERAGIVGPSVGSKTREVLVRQDELEEML